MHPLTNPVRDYAWGSTSHIPRLCGWPVSDDPVAEVWYGAHASAPSTVPDGRGLDDVILQAPADCLGERALESFGPRLPFLLKLLAAGEPLSLQVHPSSERARIRYAEQNAAGVALTAPDRSYKDGSHKPELIYALTRFEGLAGFRDTQGTAQILRMLQLPWLDAIADDLETSKTPFQTLRRIVTDLLAITGEDLTGALADLGVAAQRAEEESHRAPWRAPRSPDPSSVERESVRVFEQTRSLAARYPADAGVLVTLLLNHVVLAPGEAVFIPAGMIHAYTSGFGVEVMASSDNVLRAGLTPKHVDVPELLEITDFTPVPPPLWAGTAVRRTDAVVFAPPVDEFELLVSQLRGDFLDLPGDGPAIMVVLEGSLDVVTDGDRRRLAPGESVFVESSEGGVRVSGEGRIAVARTPSWPGSC